jgi:hypothetical protein
MFTVAMVDADIVGTDESGNQTRHWLANNVALTSGEDGAFGLNYTTDPITNYAGPGPAEGSGAHSTSRSYLPLNPSNHPFPS